MKKDKKLQLLNKHRYSSMLGLQSERPLDDLENEKKEYEELLPELKISYDKYNKGLEFVNSLISSINYALEEYKRKRLIKVKPTEEHRKLLKNMYFTGMWLGDTVSIGVDGKRPFGNSDCFGDVAKILEWELPNEDLSDDQRRKADELLDELPYVLNEILSSE